MDSSRIEVCSGNPHKMWLAQGVFEWLRFLNSQSRPGMQRIMEAIMLQMRKGTMEELLATAEVRSASPVTQWQRLLSLRLGERAQQILETNVVQLQECSMTEPPAIASLPFSALVCRATLLAYMCACLHVWTGTGRRPD